MRGVGRGRGRAGRGVLLCICCTDLFGEKYKINVSTACVSANISMHVKNLKNLLTLHFIHLYTTSLV